MQYRMRIFNFGTLTSSNSRQITALLGCWSFPGEGFLMCIVRDIWIYAWSQFAGSAQPDNCRTSVQLSTRRRFPLHRRAWFLTADADNDVMHHTWIREVPGSNFGWITGYPDRSLSCFARPLQANVGTVRWNKPRKFLYLLDTQPSFHLTGH